MNQLKRLIVNADDFGLHPSINTAVLDGHLNGIITSASLMAGMNAEAFDDAVRISKETPSLQVGLHFTLVGAPHYPSGYGSFLGMRLLGAFPPARVASLLNKQLTRIERSGIRVNHIDSHQHLHTLPALMRVVCKVAKERGIPYVRLPLESNPAGASLARRSSSRALAALAKRARAEINRNGLACADQFMGMAISGHLNEARLLQMIEQIPEGAGVTEIVCHPGADNRALEARFGWGYDWEAELGAVKNKVVRDAVERLIGV